MTAQDKMVTEYRELPESSRLFGHLSMLRDDVLGTLEAAFATCGDVGRLRFGHLRVFLLAHPEHVEHVLLRNHTGYDKNLRTYKHLSAILGNGLVTSDGDFWQRQRRVAQPAFSHGRIQRFAGIMTRASESIADGWEEAARRGESVDVHRDMMTLALEIAGEALLGAEVRSHSETVARGLDIFLGDFHVRIHQIFSLPDWVPTPRNRVRRQALRDLSNVIYGIIEAHRQSPRDDNLLGMLMAARDEETGEAMTDLQLHDEAMTILLAGHETTANALAWTFYLLAKNPDAAESLRAELSEVLDGRTPTVKDLSALSYTKMVLEESMRLMPPVWVVERRCREGDRLPSINGGPETVIPANSVVMASPWITHRHPDFWEDPERFEPRRFHPQNPICRKQKHRQAYFPFSAGPRVCIGGSFAMLEARLALAILAQRFELSLPENAVIVPEPTVTLRPAGGLTMKVRDLTTDPS